MTGLYYGIGLEVTIAVILLAYVPFISVAFLWRNGLFNAVRKQLRIVVVVLVFLCLAAFTLLIIRSAPYVALDWLLAFALIATLAWLIIKFIKGRKVSGKT